jgi:hypothetical protein
MRFASPLYLFMFFALLAAVFLYINFWDKKFFNPAVIF